MRLIDAHCHLHAYPLDERLRFSEIRITAVSEDYRSSINTLKLKDQLNNVAPFVGLHPWEVGEGSDEELSMILELAYSGGVAGIGEVGIDRRYSKAPLEVQRRIYEDFCKAAAELKLPLNVHALDCWQEAFDIALRNDVRSALFHWYNGPERLLKEIEGAGYFISINPSLKIQDKHRRVAAAADISIILTESDGPYNYRGLRLEPPMVIETLRALSELKGMEVDYAASVISANYEKYSSR